MLLLLLDGTGNWQQQTANEREQHEDEEKLIHKLLKEDLGRKVEQISWVYFVVLQSNLNSLNAS